MPVPDEFRAGVLSYRERVAKFRAHVTNEEATKIALIQPFINLLGYDDRDPTEVSPEHAADFSEKYKNRVDYAILVGGAPVIAIECKSVNNSKKDDRGQLKSYFNAVKTIKLGILTDGIIYEFFVDSNDPNILDDDPFMRIDFGSEGDATISETTLEGLHALTKQAFDPDSVAEKARRTLIHRLLYEYLSTQFNEPSKEFTHFLLRENGFKHIKAPTLDTFRVIARAAFRDVFNFHILKRLDITSAPAAAQVASEAPTETGDHGAGKAIEKVDKPEVGIVTTEAELRAFEQVRRRLAFLAAGDATLFQAIDHIYFKDYLGKMVVYYKMVQKGRILDIIEGKDGIIRYVVIDGGDSEPFGDLSTVDARLRQLFAKRIEELK